MRAVEHNVWVASAQYFVVVWVHPRTDTVDVDCTTVTLERLVLVLEGITTLEAMGFFVYISSYSF